MQVNGDQQLKVNYPFKGHHLSSQPQTGVVALRSHILQTSLNSSVLDFLTSPRYENCAIISSISKISFIQFLIFLFIYLEHKSSNSEDSIGHLFSMLLHWTGTEFIN